MSDLRKTDREISRLEGDLSRIGNRVSTRSGQATGLEDIHRRLDQLRQERANRTAIFDQDIFGQDSRRDGDAAAGSIAGRGLSALDMALGDGDDDDDDDDDDGVDDLASNAFDRSGRDGDLIGSPMETGSFFNMNLPQLDAETPPTSPVSGGGGGSSTPRPSPGGGSTGRGKGRALIDSEDESDGSVNSQTHPIASRTLTRIPAAADGDTGGDSDDSDDDAFRSAQRGRRSNRSRRRPRRAMSPGQARERRAQLRQARRPWENDPKNPPQFREPIYHDKCNHSKKADRSNRGGTCKWGESFHDIGSHGNRTVGGKKRKGWAVSGNIDANGNRLYRNRPLGARGMFAKEYGAHGSMPDGYEGWNPNEDFTNITFLNDQLDMHNDDV